MGNQDGFTSALVASGSNTVIYFDGGCFSFAFGNEIAMCLDDKNGYFILNCNSDLFEEVKKEVESGKTKDELITFWLEKAKNYEKSDWSASFEQLAASLIEG